MDDRRPDVPDGRLEALFAAELAAAERDYVPRVAMPTRRRSSGPALSLALVATVAIGVATIVRLAGEAGLPISSGSPSASAAALTTPAESELPRATDQPTPPLDMCAAALAGGTLLTHERWGIALDRGGELVQVRWPRGYVHRDDEFGRALVDPDGRVVARVGDVVRIGGGYVPGRGNVWGACHIPPVVDIVDAAVPVPNAAPRDRGLLCMAAHLGGELVAHDDWGVAVGPGEPIRKVVWPHGFFARDDERGRALVNDRGRVVGYVGESGGAGGGGDPFRACPGSIRYFEGARISVPTHEPPTGNTACHLALGGGELVADDQWGMAIRQGDQLTKVIWPNGYGAIDAARGRALVDEEDAIVGYVGDNVSFTGGYLPGEPRTFSTCQSAPIEGWSD
jgi:hypothetical protein